MKTRIFAGALAIAMSFAAPAEADTSHLSRDISREITRDSERAIKSFARLMTTISMDGVVSQETVALYDARLMAAARAKRLSMLLAHDLDFDGDLSAAEVRNAAAASSRRRSDMLLMLAEADQNLDGVVSYDEMRAIVLAEFKRPGARVVRRHYGIALLELDMDNDGILDIAEMARSVRKLSNTCANSCAAD